MPTEQGESITDEPSDPTTPTATHFPQPPEEVTSLPTRPEEEEEAPARGPESDQSEAMQAGQEEETGPSQAGQSHVIKNVDEIFHTIEGLMSKLRQLKVGRLSPSLC